MAAGGRGARDRRGRAQGQGGGGPPGPAGGGEHYIRSQGTILPTLMRSVNSACSLAALLLQCHLQGSPPVQAARKQREREAELEEKKRREREAIIAGAAQQRASPAPSPEKPDSAPAPGGGSGYLPPSRRTGGVPSSATSHAAVGAVTDICIAFVLEVLCITAAQVIIFWSHCVNADHSLCDTGCVLNRLCAPDAAHTGDGACRCRCLSSSGG